MDKDPWEQMIKLPKLIHDKKLAYLRGTHAVRLERRMLLFFHGCRAVLNFGNNIFGIAPHDAKYDGRSLLRRKNSPNIISIASGRFQSSNAGTKLKLT
jgi:hypothetical protein